MAVLEDLTFMELLRKVVAIDSFALKNRCSRFMVVSLTIDKTITYDKGLISTDCESDVPLQPTPPTKTCLHLNVSGLSVRDLTPIIYIKTILGV